MFVLFFLGRGGVRNESRVAKVALMKLKMKATGDSSIPQVCASCNELLIIIIGNIKPQLDHILQPVEIMLHALKN